MLAITNGYNMPVTAHHVNKFLLKDLIPVEDFSNNPFNYLSNKATDRELRLLNYLIFLNDRCKSLYVSQETLALFAGITREWANKAIKKFCRMGLITKVYRHKQTCLYYVSSFFDDFFNRNKLKDLLSSLRFLPLFLLFSPQSSHNTNKELFKSLSYSQKKGGCSMKSYLIEQIGTQFQLGSDQKEQLLKYSEEILHKAQKKIATTTGIRDRVKYFFSICRNESQKKVFTKIVTYPSDNIPPKPAVPAHEIVQMQFKSFDREEEEKKAQELYAMPEWIALEKKLGITLRPPICEGQYIQKYVMKKIDGRFRRILNPEWKE